MVLTVWHPNRTTLAGTNLGGPQLDQRGTPSLRSRHVYALWSDSLCRYEPLLSSRIRHWKVGFLGIAPLTRVPSARCAVLIREIPKMLRIRLYLTGRQVTF